MPAVPDERGRCASCGDEDVEVVAVRRLYVTPASWDTDERIDRVDEVELWCFPCRTHYPHEDAEA